MYQNVYLSRECLKFLASASVLDQIKKFFRARTQMFLWSSLIFFCNLLQLVTHIFVFSNFSDRNWLAYLVVQTLKRIFCTMYQNVYLHRECLKFLASVSVLDETKIFFWAKTWIIMEFFNFCPQSIAVGYSYFSVS